MITDPYAKFRDFVWIVMLAVAVAGVFAAAHVGVSEIHSALSAPSAPVDPPHIASDCRAACTLEGMELAGVELGAPDGRATCLCAPVSRGDL